MDELYYEEYYTEWLSYRSVFKKWEDKIGITSILLAAILFLLVNTALFVSIGLFVFGTLMLTDYYRSKRKWMKDRLNGNMLNQQVTIIFEERQIRSKGPFTEMTGKWDFIQQAIETKKGLFLIPENGISIYLQKTSFDHPSDINTLIKKVKEKQTGLKS